ncbi:MAG: hypothetical protein ACXW2H_07860, partial [Candidatus Aminicenantales bacterium]
MSKALRLILIVIAIVVLLFTALLAQETQAPTLDKAQKQAIVDEIATLLNKNYIFAEMAKKIEEALRAKLATGGFDNLDEARRFAQAVSKDLLEISKDRHIGFNYDPQLADGLRRLESRSKEEAKKAHESELETS